MRIILVVCLLVAVTGCAFLGIQSEYGPTSTHSAQQWKIKKIPVRERGMDYMEDMPLAVFENEELSITVDPIVKNQIPLATGLIVPVIPIFFIAGGAGKDRSLVISFTPKVKDLILTADAIKIDFENKGQNKTAEVYMDKDRIRKNIEIKWVDTDLNSMRVALVFRVPEDTNDSKFSMSFVNLKLKGKKTELEPLHFKSGNRFLFFYLSGP